MLIFFFFSDASLHFIPSSLVPPNLNSTPPSFLPSSLTPSLPHTTPRTQRLREEIDERKIILNYSSANFKEHYITHTFSSILLTTCLLGTVCLSVCVSFCPPPRNQCRQVDRQTHRQVGRHPPLYTWLSAPLITSHGNTGGQHSPGEDRKWC